MFLCLDMTRKKVKAFERKHKESLNYLPGYAVDSTREIAYVVEATRITFS